MATPQEAAHPAELTRRVKQRARELGFRRAAVCPAGEPQRLEQFHQWLAAGYAGEMRYLSERQDAYAHPDSVLDGARSIVMLTVDYKTDTPVSPANGSGRVSQYAWGEQDYHDLIHPRLKQLVASVKLWSPGANARGVIDTAPLLERDFAEQAGLGWIGKNTLLLSMDGGSLFFLAAMLVDVPLEYDDPMETDHCGTCTACLDACPTDAFPQPHVLDATRCISYLTIELRDAIPRSLRRGIGDWVFGCDVCQDVCPWNRHSHPSQHPELAARPQMNPCELTRLFEMSEREFRQEFRRTPLWRSRRRGILRNAAIVLGNQRDSGAVAALSRGLADEESLVRGASAWALGEIGSPPAREQLQLAIASEADRQVRDEIEAALSAIDGQHPKSGGQSSSD